jgi:hypothetical protein
MSTHTARLVLTPGISVRAVFSCTALIASEAVFAICGSLGPRMLAVSARRLVYTASCAMLRMRRCSITSMLAPSPRLLTPSPLVCTATEEAVQSERRLPRAFEEFLHTAETLWLWLSSTLKKRRAKMNKHKLKKRRRRDRFSSKKK